jgi:hypothetical protein
MREEVRVVFVGTPDGKRLLGRPKHGQECDMKMYIQEEDLGAWTSFICPGYRHVADVCE